MPSTQPNSNFGQTPANGAYRQHTSYAYQAPVRMPAYSQATYSSSTATLPSQQSNSYQRIDPDTVPNVVRIIEVK